VRQRPWTEEELMPEMETMGEGSMVEEEAEARTVEETTLVPGWVR
jgi:hypothetical protein